MLAQIRLIAQTESDATEVNFRVAWAAVPAQGAEAPSAPACLDTGDGHLIDIGLLCAPTAATWCSQRQVDLASYRYNSFGPYTAKLRWGGAFAEATCMPGRGELRVAAVAQPTVTLFLISQVADQPLQRLVKLRVEGLVDGQLLRLDGGAGQVRWFSNADSVAQGIAAGAELSLEYAKPGPYIVLLDLLDADGFWLATLAQCPIKIVYPDEALAAAMPAFSAAEPRAEIPGSVTPVELPAAPQPWLPYRYIKPRYSVNTYASPGGGAVRRSVNPGIHLSVRAEAMVGSQTWFKTAGGDWIAASAVTILRTSELRGIEVGGTPPPPPPPPTDTRQGIVTATVLNVRARPGVAADNPPIGTLRSGAAVTIYAEDRVAGELWYRIGEDRWVYGGYVRIVNTAVPLPTPPAPETQRGIVTATALNARARPGVAANNPPVAVLRAGAAVTVYETRSIAGESWYRIGENRWVLGQWVRLLDAVRAVATTGVMPEVTLPTHLPAGWVVTSTLNVRARPGVAADNPPVGQLVHNQAVSILEERSVSGVRWFRIADGQWVEGRNIGVARVKRRPAGIGVGERWVGVCLAEQTAVAYEGDRPIYAALIASGLPGTPTVQGIFRTWLRLAAGKMSGSGYYLEDVTWTCYFYSGYALHTAYWHDAFGKPRSHGCVNMSPYDAWWVYQWSALGGKNSPAVHVYWA